jgi:nicotinamide riboside kinase
LKIGITGTYSTGKTLLAKTLSERLPLTIITEQNKIINKKYGLKSISTVIKDKNLARDYQISIMLTQLQKEKLLFSGFVTDMTIIDCLAYWISYGLENDPLNSLYREMCMNCQYDALIYVPPEEPMKDDVFYDNSEIRRLKLDLIIRELVQVTRIPFITCRGTSEERVARAMKFTEKVGDYGEPSQNIAANDFLKR